MAVRNVRCRVPPLPAPQGRVAGLSGSWLQRPRLPLRLQGRGAPRLRLLVAGISDWGEQAVVWHRENRMRDFCRHLLPPADGYASGVVQFGALFLVADKAVGEASRDWSLERVGVRNPDSITRRPRGTRG